MERKALTAILLYLLCLYDFYLYLPDILDLFHVDFFAPDPGVLIYFDAAMLLFGGLVLGLLLRRQPGKFNKYLGALMILSNLILTPLFIWRALP
ncbi:hypothetical protein [Mucilaginibacter pallidiroseus]|nr:hypothetical protein [Mucilaginibacter pallidiroseus]